MVIEWERKRFSRDKGFEVFFSFEYCSLPLVENHMHDFSSLPRFSFPLKTVLWSCVRLLGRLVSTTDAMNTAAVRIIVIHDVI